MLHLIKAYLNFLWHSKNQHGVHSPFVYALVTKCFYDKKKYKDYKILKEYRNALLRDKSAIEVTDFGAGSRVFKSNTRQISKIAETAGISPKRAELLYRIVAYFQPENILEIGTSLGLATSALSLGTRVADERSAVYPKAKIVTLEGCPETSEIAKTQLQKFNCNNVDCVVSEFYSYLSKTATGNCDWKLIYFDGNHSKKATLDYFELLLPSITNETVWVFDDIHWSEDMEAAWETIKNHPKVTVTIDTFQWGFVFFRYEQEKEHFVIRI